MLVEAAQLLQHDTVTAAALAPALHSFLTFWHDTEVAASAGLCLSTFCFSQT